MTSGRRAAVALVLALLAAAGSTIVLMGVAVASRLLRTGQPGSATGYAVSALLHVAVGGSLLLAAFAGLRRINRRGDDSLP